MPPREKSVADATVMTKTDARLIEASLNSAASAAAEWLRRAEVAHREACDNLAAAKRAHAAACANRDDAVAKLHANAN
jgi:hypothetical protein